MAALAIPAIEAIATRVLIALGIGVASAEAGKEIAPQRRAAAEKAVATPLAKADACTRGDCKPACRECPPDRGAYSHQSTAGWSAVAIAYQQRICAMPPAPMPACLTEWQWMGIDFDGFESDLWNGREELHQGASLSCWYAETDGRPSSVDLDLPSSPGVSRLGTPQQVIALFASACWLYTPVCAWLWNHFRAYKPVFQDRPGVGWMLYLPRTLTGQQVPGARALVPVTVEDDWKIPHQIGTIIVSVNYEPFDETNSEHARIANAIEIRLVDQDLLLLRYADL